MEITNHQIEPIYKLKHKTLEKASEDELNFIEAWTISLTITK